MAKHRRLLLRYFLTPLFSLLLLTVPCVGGAFANPWNGKVILQTFWWNQNNEKYPGDWYTYLAKLAPRLSRMGIDGIWIPAPSKGASGGFSMGYDPYDHYDLGDKDQKGTVPTKFGNKDSLLRLVAVAHANGLEVYPDIVLNHTNGGERDPQAPGKQHKRLRYAAFAGPGSGRWPKDHWNFHPNPDHNCSSGDLCTEKDFGPDNCFEDAQHGGGGNGKYMRDKGREWLVWLRKQMGVDGFRFDAVKHYPADVVEDFLYNAMGDRKDYVAICEIVEYNRGTLDDYVSGTKDRCGVFDFSFRGGLASLVDAGGFFDMGSLPNYQQGKRFKTYPFVNSHDTWRGAYWDSRDDSSLQHDDRDQDWRQNGGELAPTIDPDNQLAPVAYAAAFSVDGSPVVYYEDLFVNYGPDRYKADPNTIATRNYLANLIWSHKKLNFKDGSYKVRYQGSGDLLVIERSGKALIGMNDNGNATLSATVQTDFGPGVTLHDYSGSNQQDLRTNQDGSVQVSVPPHRYAVWGPAGLSGGFTRRALKTTQEFQLDDDLGDASQHSPGYGGKLIHGSYRNAGAVWAAANTWVKVTVYAEAERQVDLAVYQPDTKGGKSKGAGKKTKSGKAGPAVPLSFRFKAEREGYHQLMAKLTGTGAPIRGYLKVEYEAPAESSKF